MNIHEYQAKALLDQYQVPVPKGVSAQTEADIECALESLDGSQTLVVKAQIHAGGRGKGSFTDGFKGGVQLCESQLKQSNRFKDVATTCRKQTGPDGRKVQTVYFTETCDIAHEYYLALPRSRECSSCNHRFNRRWHGY